MKSTRNLFLLVVAIAATVRAASAQAQATDPSARLREVLPPDVAQRVLDRIADARARQLPTEALENRALKFAAKGVDPRNIERSLNEQVDRMSKTKNAINTARTTGARAEEIEAGAEAMRKGVSGESISALAKSAPSGRSLAVPLFVIASLTDRGLPSAQALNRVMERLKAHASDAELEAIPVLTGGRSDGAKGREQDEAGRGSNGNQRPAVSGKPSAAGPPAGVPGNGGSKANPRKPKR